MVILDEASSALNPITEVKLNEMFLNIFKDKIVFIISHRLSTTKNCDKILVMKNGEIVEIGNHKELMERKGEYFEMFTQQSLQYIEN